MLNSHSFRKTFFLICLVLLSPNVLSAVFNVSNTQQLRQALLDAALNGQDDWIVLAAGVYKTTSDGLGTFRFSDAEEFFLVIKGQDGLKSSDVILDGDGTDQVLFLKNTQESTVWVSNLTIRNGNSFGLIVNQCGGLYADIDAVYVYDVSVLNNAGSGICTAYPYVTSVGIRDSVISGNTDSSHGGLNLRTGSIYIDRTKIIGNHSARSYDNAAVYISWTPLVSVNTVIITNSVIANNEGGGIDTHGFKTSIVNTTIAGNSGIGIKVFGTFVNNIFNNNGDGDANTGTFYNNYIDYTKLSPSALLKNNILPSAGDPDFIDADYRIGENSVVIDKGLDPNTTTFENLFPEDTVSTIRDALQTDKDGRPRVVGAAIDMGAYEYDAAYIPPVDLSGTIKTSDGTDICAMVLASGQFMFSCSPTGVFSLSDLSSEQDGTVKRQIYADGFFPKVDTLTGSSNDAVVLTRSGTCPDYNTPSNPIMYPNISGKWIDISGTVSVGSNGDPVCAMVLANGQHMFSCDGSGSYTLNIPLDIKAQFKLQVYADGFAPTIQTFDEFSTINDVRMARAVECQ